MRKIKLLITLVACVLIQGCSSVKIEKAQNLEEAYFEILEKRYNKEEINEEYLKGLLSGYEYEKGEELKIEDGNIDGSDYIQQPYNFKNGKEELVLTHLNNEGKESIDPLYSIKNENEQVTLSFIESSEDVEDKNKKKFMIFVNGDNIKTHKEIDNKLVDNNGNWNEVYNSISDNIIQDNDIDIGSIKSLIKEKPLVEEYKDDLKIYQNEPDLSKIYNITSYVFENDEEMLTLEYIKEKDKIWNVFYINKNTSTTKTTINKPLINNKEKLHIGLSAYVKTIDNQKELLNIINK